MSKHPNIGLPPAVVGWIKNHAVKNLWRVSSYYEVDDLFQDGLMLAYKCQQRYGTDLDPPHFMALVKSAFRNHIGELIRSKRGVDDQCTKISDLVGKDSQRWSESEVFDRIRNTPRDYSPQELLVLLGDLPDKMIDALLYLLSEEGLKKLCSKRVRVGHFAEKEKVKIDRLTKIPNFEAKLREMLGVSPNASPRSFLLDLDQPTYNMVKR